MDVASSQPMECPLLKWCKARTEEAISNVDTTLLCSLILIVWPVYIAVVTRVTMGVIDHTSPDCWLYWS